VSSWGATVRPVRQWLVGAREGLTSPEFTGRWGPALRAGLAVWLASRVALFLAGVLFVYSQPGHGGIGRPGFWPVGVFYAWDSGQLRRIATLGYTGLTDFAFFPGYPKLARLLADLLGGSHLQIAIMLSIVAWAGAAAAAVAIWRLGADKYDERVATRAAVILLFGPFAYFLVAPYTEGMFLGLAVWAWLCGTRRHWWLAGLLGGLAGFTRINGVFLGAALITMYVEQHWSGRRLHIRPDSAALLLPFAGVFAYFAYLRALTGRWTTWFSAQSLGWHRHLTEPLMSLRVSVEHVTRSTLPTELRFQYALELVFAAIGVAFVVVFAATKAWSEFVYCLLTMAVELTSTFYLSVPRAVLLLFPIPLVIAAWSCRRGYAWLLPALASVSVPLLAYQMSLFVDHRWAG